MIYVAHLIGNFVDEVTVEPDDCPILDGMVLIGSENIVGIGAIWDGESFKDGDE